MRWVSILRAMSFAVLAMLILASAGASVDADAAQASDASIASGVLLLMQGETDSVAGVESDDDFYALKILNYELPHNIARVYTKVPDGAREVNVWYGMNTLNQSQYGRETSGTHTGEFYIDVPTSHPRTANYSVIASSLADFTATGSQLGNVNYTSGAIRMVDEEVVGTYLSPNITIQSAFEVRSLLLTLNGASTGNISSHVSTDGGTTWWSTENATLLNVTSGGTTVRVMFELTGNSSLGYSTALSSFQITTVYVPFTTAFTVHVSYLWTAEFSDRKTLIDLSEELPFTGNGSYFIMVYTLPGTTATGNGFQLTFDANRSMNTYDDKDLYYASSIPTGTLSYSVEIVMPSQSSVLAIYSVVIVLALAIAGAFLYARSRAKKPTSVKEEEPAPSEDSSSSEEDEERRKELVAKKKAMLEEIEDIKGRLSSGELSQADASVALARLKKEFKAVRNELNRLSRKPKQVAHTDEPVPEQDAALAALARLDEDFEKGRLPESSYKKLRKEYVQRAASVMAARSASARGVLSPLEQEKNKLMEAVVALDDEHDRGEIDDKVYSDLRTSYMRQLADLMKRTKPPEEG